MKIDNTELVEELNKILLADYGEYGVQEFMRDLSEEYKRVSRPSGIAIYLVFEKTEYHLIEDREAFRLEEFAD